MTERISKSAEETTLEDIKLNYTAIKQNIAEAMDKAGRCDTVRIMAVTKTVPCEKINYAESLGIDLLGENRVQEFLGKYENYSEKSEIHFIGGLQKNKVKYIIDKVSMIHSVDSVELAAEIDRRAGSHGLVKDILLEINIGGEESKGGIAPSELIETAKAVSGLENVRIRGLMTIPPVNCDEKYFASMQELFENSKQKYSFLSGMESYSNELESAKEEPVQEAPSRSSSQASNANKIYTYNASTTLHLVVNRPKKLSDTAEIAELYKNKTTVILMLNNTNKDIATRIIDFLGGVSYITGGEIKRIADTTYVLAPYNVDISGEFIDEISSISGEDIFDDLD